MGEENKQTVDTGCGCLSLSLGCCTLIFMFLFLCWFLFMGGCSLIVKKTNESLSNSQIELTSPK